MSLVLVNNIELSDKSCIIRIGGLMKTSSPLFYNRFYITFRFPADPQDETICPVVCIHECINQTESFHKCHDKQLFLSYTKLNNLIS